MNFIDTYRDLVLEKGTHVVQTASGRSVRIVCTDMKSRYATYPIIAVIDFGAFEEHQIYTAAGETIWRRVRDTDLQIVPKPPVSLGWVAVVHNTIASVCTNPFKTKETLLEKVKEVGATLLSEPVEMFAIPAPPVTTPPALPELASYAKALSELKARYSFLDSFYYCEPDKLWCAAYKGTNPPEQDEFDTLIEAVDYFDSKLF